MANESNPLTDESGLVLIVTPHPDDADRGAGVLARLKTLRA